MSSGRPTSVARLLDIYEALEERNYRTVLDLACCLDSGTPATQAQVQEQAWTLVADLPDTIGDIPARVAVPR